MGHYTLAVSLVFIVLVFGHSPGQFLYLLLFYGWSYLVVRGYAAVRAKNRRNEKHTTCSWQPCCCPLYYVNYRRCSI